jgi:hypothetical protein
MDAEVQARTGAAHSERDPARLVQRNGYHERAWEARAGAHPRPVVNVEPPQQPPVDLLRPHPPVQPRPSGDPSARPRSRSTPSSSGASFSALANASMRVPTSRCFPRRPCPPSRIRAQPIPRPHRCPAALVPEGKMHDFSGAATEQRLSESKAARHDRFRIGCADERGERRPGLRTALLIRLETFDR